MSAMKGITKACFSLQYESSMRRKCALCLRPYIPVPPYLWGVSYFYEIMIAFKFCFVVKSSTFRVQKISRIYLHSYHFTLQNYFYVRMQYIFTRNS